MLKPAGHWMDPYLHLLIHYILLWGRGEWTAAQPNSSSRVLRLFPASWDTILYYTGTWYNQTQLSQERRKKQSFVQPHLSLLMKNIRTSLLPTPASMSMTSTPSRATHPHPHSSMLIELHLPLLGPSTFSKCAHSTAQDWGAVSILIGPLAKIGIPLWRFDPFQSSYLHYNT